VIYITFDLCIIAYAVFTLTLFTLYRIVNFDVVDESTSQPFASLVDGLYREELVNDVRNDDGIFPPVLTRYYQTKEQRVEQTCGELKS